MSDEPVEVTEELLAALEFRYAPEPLCRVCGAALQVSDSRGMKMTCTGDGASPLKSRYEAAGVTWKEALEHWERSVSYNPPLGDRAVLAVVAELRRLRDVVRLRDARQTDSERRGREAELRLRRVRAALD